MNVGNPFPRDLRRLIASLALIATLVAGIATADLARLIGNPWLPAAAQSSELSVEAVAELANPAVVTVTNLQLLSTRGGGGERLQPVSVGSGFIIDAAGHILTNSHVVDGAADLAITFADGTDADATLLGNDPFQDVAVIQLDLTDGQTIPGTVILGDADALDTADTVVAIGTALGEYPNTVTSGSVSAVDRALDTGYGYELANLIQHNAELWPGDSGGPLLNLDGEVIGMNVAAASSSRRGGGTQIGFAIEIDAAIAIAEQIIATGEMPRPFLGIEGEPQRDGYLVTDVVAGGPADAADLAAGDLITALSGAEIDDDDPLLNQLFEHAPGDTVTLTIERDGADQTLTITLGERPDEIA